MTKDEALREAIDTLKSTKHGNCDFAWIDETLKKCTEALAQPPLPVQEQQQVGPVEDMLLRRAVLRSAKIVSDGRFVTKQAALEQPPLPVQRQPLTDDEARTLEALKYAAAKGYGLRGMKIGRFIIKGDETLAQPPLPVQPEPVKLRRGDILRCIETDELCTVWATSTTNKTLIKWSANNFGNYTAEQIGELFWIEQQAKPMAWDKPSASFDEWWDGDRRRDTANPFTDSFSYWAFEGWQAALAQRPWQGLTDEEIETIGDKVANEDLVGLVSNFRVRLARAIEQTLKERNTWMRRGNFRKN